MQERRFGCATSTPKGPAPTIDPARARTTAPRSVTLCRASARSGSMTTLAGCDACLTNGRAKIPVRHREPPRGSVVVCRLMSRLLSCILPTKHRRTGD